MSTQTQAPPLSQGTSTTLEAAQSLLPFLGGDEAQERQFAYLSYRYVGFSFREALQFSHTDQATVIRWRRDKDFFELEQGSLAPNRTQIRKEILHTLFNRNLYLVLKKDEQEVRRLLNLDLDTDGEPIRPDFKWLDKMQGRYAPSQLEVMERILKPGSAVSEGDFTEFVLTRKRERSITTNGQVLTQTETTQVRSTSPLTEITSPVEESGS